MKTDLSKFDNSWYNPGNSLKRACWYVINLFFFKNALFPFNKLKILLLKSLGAKIGKNVIIKPCVNIKYGWNLEIADNVWIGENDGA